MSSRIVAANSLAFTPFTLPGFSGKTAAAFANTDTASAPFIALLRMEPGAVLAKHFHPNARECVYVVAGTMINDGVALEAGSYVVHGPGVMHGPHATETGCTLMFIQDAPVGPDDSVFA